MAAGGMDEFDDAVPLRSTYCSRMTEQEYENQAAETTEKALSDLLKHLDSNPDIYRQIETKRRRQEAEDAGIVSLIKVPTVRGLVRYTCNVDPIVFGEFRTCHVYTSQN